MASMQEVANVLRALESEAGRLNPEAVVDAARDPASPLHGYFEWDNDEAAKQHRLGQARQLIRKVKIEISVHSIPVEVPRYMRDRDDGNSGYRDIVRVRSDEDAARAVVVDEMMRVTKAARRAKAVAAVLGDTADIEKIEALAAAVINRPPAVEQPEGNA